MIRDFIRDHLARRRLRRDIEAWNRIVVAFMPAHPEPYDHESRGDFMSRGP